MQEALFSQALGLMAPWEVAQVGLDVKANRIDLHIAWNASKAACSACGAPDQALHDHRLSEGKPASSALGPCRQPLYFDV